MFRMYSKRLPGDIGPASGIAVLRELVHGATRVAVLVNPTNGPVTALTLRDVGEAVRALGLRLRVLNAGTNKEIDEAFSAL